MPKSLCVRLLFLILSAAAGSSCSSFAEDEFVPGEVLVQFEVGTTEQAVRTAIEAQGVTWGGVVNSFGASVEGPLVLVRVPVGEERKWVDRLAALPRVVSSQLNLTVRPV